MSSTSKTENLGLSQWEQTDPFSREDLNSDLQKLDTAAAYLPVKLLDFVLEEDAESFQLDLAGNGINADDYDELIMYLNIENGRSQCIRINGLSSSIYEYALNSSNSTYMDICPGKLRIFPTRSLYHLQLDTRTTHRFIKRTYVTSVRTIQFLHSNDGYTYKAGDHIRIYGIKW